MIIDVAICIKAHSCQDITLVEGQKYDVSKCADGGLLIFLKNGWFKITDWSENIEILEE